MTTLPQTTPMRAPRPGMTALAIPGAVPVLAHQPQAVVTMSGNDVLRVLRANAWLISLLLIVGGAVGYGINSWLAINRPRYTSTGLVRIMSESDFPRIGEFSPSQSGAGVELEAHEQAAKIQHGDLIMHVLDSNPEIRKTRWFQQFVHQVNGKSTVSVEDAKVSLLENLDVARVPDSRLLAISFSTVVPADARTIVEVLMNQHIADQREARVVVEGDQSRLLSRMQLQYEGDLGETQSRLAKLSKQLSDEGQPLEGRGYRETQFETLVAEQLRANASLAEQKSRYDKLRKDLISTNTSPAVEDAIAANGNYVAKQRQVEDLKLDLVQLRQRLGPSNPVVFERQEILDLLQKEADALHEQLRKDLIQRLESQLTEAVIDSQVRVAKINAQVDAIQSKMADLAAQQNEYQRLKGEEHTSLDKLAKLKDTQENFRNWNPNGEYSNVSWYTKPEMPEVPSFPKLVNTMTMAIGLSLALGLGIAFLREVTNTSVRSPRDIARIGQLNLLGMIPHQDDDPQAVGARLPLLIMEAPHSMIAEQFRQVRTRLQHAASLDTTRSILVTGCSPGDGKTTVACNLAAGLALNGRRILLVDANFRRPQLHQIFNLDNHFGFGDLLTSADQFDHAVHVTNVPNLSVLVLGNKPSNSTELLESQLLIDFIERALEEYDHVIFDSGPLLIVSETVGLAPRVDGVVTVVRAMGDSRGVLQRLRDQLRQIKAEHLGVILNAVRVQGGGYYGPLIKSYYAYQNGSAHTNGVNGTNGSRHGTNGSNGTNGAHASNGSNGTHGANGAKGTSAANGSNGANGAHGTNGSNGADTHA